MKPLVFFREEPVVRVIERGARSAAMPVALHYAEDARNALRVVSFGQCACCQHVTTLPGGNAACRASRVPALTQSLRQSTAIPFLCHMGLACMAVPVPFAKGFVLTWGPFCPSEEPRALEDEVRAGLSILAEEPVDVLPFTLADVHVVPADAITSISEWTLEQLALLWRAQGQSEEEIPEALDASEKKENSSKSHVTVADPYLSSAISAALAAGNVHLVRQHLVSVLTETKKRTMDARRARITSAVTAALEAAQIAGLDTTKAREGLASFIETCQSSNTEPELVDAAMVLLGGIARKIKRSMKRPIPVCARKVFSTSDDASTEDPHAAFNRILWENLVEGITLNDVAAQLGQKPSAITHRLQRKYGMSFSDYYGRLRVEKAKEMLRRTRLTVTEIGRRVGVDDASNFGKLFRKFEAMSPLEYRAKVKKRKN